jgi:sporulation related protein
MEAGGRMAHHYNQRVYGQNDQSHPHRSGETAHGDENKASFQRGGDPLAELARLIGEKDPFAEYGREVNEFQRSSLPQGSYAASTAHRPPRRASPVSGSPYPGGDAYYGEEVRSPRPERGVHHDALHGYEAKHPQGNYEDGSDNQGMDSYDGEDQDFYEDIDPPRRRTATFVIAGILGLAILGTGGAFAFRNFFGSDNINHQPNVIKASSAPTKVVPPNARSNKSITNHIDERATQNQTSEKIVPREEQPLDLQDRPLPADQRGQASSAPPAMSNPATSNNPPLSGTGIVAVEPKRVRTIPILPDGTAITSSTPNAVISSAPKGELASQVAGIAPQPSPSRGKRIAPVPASNNTATAIKRPAIAPSRVASAGPTVPTSTTMNTTLAVRAGSYGVQVTSQRSESEAQAALRGLQAKYPGQLGGKKFYIHKVTLGAKGNYFRAMIGPFADASSANELCNGLKATGAQCIVQKN